MTVMPFAQGTWHGSSALLEYLTEDGAGSLKDHHVADLIPPAGTKLSLVIIFESPHLDELASGLPVSGKAGRDALRFLTSQDPAPDALGPFVNVVNRGTSNAGIALMNVSGVPLERTAYAYPALRPRVTDAEWDMLDGLRASTPRSVSTIRPGLRSESAQLLLAGFQSRITSLGSLSGATVAVAGTFAQLYWRSIRPTPVAHLLEVPHPSYDQWNRPTNQGHKGLAALRQTFLALAP